jgi:Uma2 family endonuclease
MRALVLEPSQEWLDDRRRRGADVRDEVWDGVLHMVPQPSTHHQRLALDLAIVLTPLADTRGLQVWHETALLRPSDPERDYRVPDVMCARPAICTERGIEGDAELVVEVRSPKDESYEKLPFYESLGVREVWILEPKTRACDVFVLRGGALHLLSPDASGALRSEALGLAMRVVDGPKLRLEWEGGGADV